MKICAVLLFFLVAVSCSKEVSDPSLGSIYPQKKYRIKKIKNYSSDGKIIPLTTFNYNEKGLLTSVINYYEESYQIVYDSLNRPFRVNLSKNGQPINSYCTVTWGRNQFTYTKFSRDTVSVICHTLNEHRITKKIAKISAGGQHWEVSENCTWFGNDSLYVNSFNSLNGRPGFWKYTFLENNGPFRDISLAVLIITDISLLKMGIYQNDLHEYAYNDGIGKIWVRYLGGGYSDKIFYPSIFNLEYDFLYNDDWHYIEYESY